MNLNGLKSILPQFGVFYYILQTKQKQTNKETNKQKNKQNSHSSLKCIWDLFEYNILVFETYFVLKLYFKQILKPYFRTRVLTSTQTFFKYRILTVI